MSSRCDWLYCKSLNVCVFLILRFCDWKFLHRNLNLRCIMLCYLNAIYIYKYFAVMLNSRAVKIANISENKVLANNSELTVVSCWCLEHDTSVRQHCKIEHCQSSLPAILQWDSIVKLIIFRSPCLPYFSETALSYWALSEFPACYTSVKQHSKMSIVRVPCLPYFSKAAL